MSVQLHAMHGIRIEAVSVVIIIIKFFIAESALVLLLLLPLKQSKAKQSEVKHNQDINIADAMTNRDLSFDEV